MRGNLIIAIVEDTWLLQRCAEAKWEQEISSPPESCLFPSDGAQPKADRQESQSARIGLLGLRIVQRMVENIFGLLKWRQSECPSSKSIL